VINDGLNDGHGGSQTFSFGYGEAGKFLLEGMLNISLERPSQGLGWVNG